MIKHTYQYVMVFTTSVRNSRPPSLGHTGETLLYTMSIFRTEAALFIPVSLKACSELGYGSTSKNVY